MRIFQLIFDEKNEKNAAKNRGKIENCLFKEN